MTGERRPEEFYQYIIRLGFCKSGQNCLDIGTGTGVSMVPDVLESWDNEHRAMLREYSDSFVVKHYVSIAWLKKK